MATVEPSAAATGDAATGHSSAAPCLARLREALAALSEACDSGDSDASEAAALAISDILDTASVEADGGSGESGDPARPGASEELLRELLEFLSRPSSTSSQMAVDALSLVLPRPVAKLGAQAGRCRDVAAAVLGFFVSSCSPRDMLSILCEALVAPMELPNGLSSFVLLLNALAKGALIRFWGGLYPDLKKAELEVGVNLMVKLAMEILSAKKAKTSSGGNQGDLNG